MTTTAVDAWTALQRTRTGLRRERRRAIPLEDRIFPFYLAAILFGYLVIVLAGVGDIGAGGVRIADSAAGRAAAQCTGTLLAALAAGVVALIAAGSVDGGPVALPAEELRVLLPAPIPRALLIRRALRAAQLRALVVALGLSAVTVLLEVALLGHRVSDCLLPTVAVSLCVAVSAVSLGWLVESSRSGRLIGRVVSGAVLAVILGAAVSVARALGHRGQLAAWGRLHDLGDSAGMRVVTRGLQPGASTSRTGPLLLVALVITGLLTAVAWRRAGRVSAERIADRSGRARALRVALLLGQTSSAYVTRTAQSRLRRRRRWAPLNVRTPRAALMIKALLQEQGAPLVSRVLLATVAGTVLEAGLFAHTTQRTIAPVQAGALGAGVLLSAVATRFADPLRIDVELATPASSLPAPYRSVAGAAMAAPALTFGVGGVLGAVLCPALGLQPWSALSDLIALGALLGPAVAAVATLAATANSPSVFTSSEQQLAFRLRGLIASIVAMSALCFVLHPVSAHPVKGDVRPFGIVVLAVLDAVLWAFAGASAAKALRQAR